MSARKTHWRKIIAAAGGVVVIPLAARMLSARLFPEPILIDRLPAVGAQAIDEWSVSGRPAREEGPPIATLGFGLLDQTASLANWRWRHWNLTAVEESAAASDAILRTSVCEMLPGNGCCPCPCGPDAQFGGSPAWGDPMAFGFHGGPFDPGGFDGGRFRTGGTSAALAFGTLAAVATGLALAQGHSSTIVAAPTVPAPLPPPEPVVVSP